MASEKYQLQMKFKKKLMAQSDSKNQNKVQMAKSKKNQHITLDQLYTDFLLIQVNNVTIKISKCKAKIHIL